MAPFSPTWNPSLFCQHTQFLLVLNVRHLEIESSVLNIFSSSENGISNIPCSNPGFSHSNNWLELRNPYCIGWISPRLPRAPPFLFGHDHS